MSRRAFRAREGRYLIEGPKVIGDALDSGIVVEDLFLDAGSLDDPTVARAREAGVRCHVVSDHILRTLADATTPQGQVAVARRSTVALPEVLASTGLILVLAQVRDPGNAGTLVRTAAAVGADAVVFTHGSVDPFGPKTLRAASGSIFKVPIAEASSLSTALHSLRQKGLTTIATDAHSERALYDLDLTVPVAVVVGNESWGIESSEAFDERAAIPMPGDVESLNVAIAGSLFLLEASRQRRLPLAQS